MATSPGVELGWTLFRDSGGKIPQDDLSAILAGQDCPPVSNRMYRHYRKLFRFGYETYLPINQLDVRVLSDPIWERAARTGYPAYEVESQVTVLIIEGSQRFMLQGVAVGLSDGEVSVKLSDPSDESTARSQKLQRRQRSICQLLFDETGETRMVELMAVTAQTSPRMTTLRFTFLDLEDVGPLMPERTSIATTTLTLTIGEDGSRLLGTTAQQLVAAFQLIEVARVLETEVLQELDPEGRWRIDPTAVRELTAGSPLVMVVSVASGVGAIVMGALKVAKAYFDVQKGRLDAQEQAYKVEASKHGVDRAQAEARSQSAVADQEEIKTDILRLELAKRKELSVEALKDLARSIVPSVAKDLGLSQGEDGVEPSTQEAIQILVERQLAPAAQRLVQYGNGFVDTSSASAA